MQTLEHAELEPMVKELTQIPSSTVDVDDTDTGRKVLEFMEALDDHDNVQNVSANFNIPQNILDQLNEA
jgi:transcriptional/translational regulatory protein YebC/TACO1